MATKKKSTTKLKSYEPKMKGGRMLSASAKFMGNSAGTRSLTEGSESLNVVVTRGSESAAKSNTDLTYIDSLAASMHESMSDMFMLGMVDQETMREFDKGCLTPVRSFDGNDIKALREREHVSQAVLSHYLGVAVNTVGQWERGERKPTGAAAKMLTLVERHGLAYLR